MPGEAEVTGTEAARANLAAGFTLLVFQIRNGSHFDYSSKDHDTSASCRKTYRFQKAYGNEVQPKRFAKAADCASTAWKSSLGCVFFVLTLFCSQNRLWVWANHLSSLHTAPAHLFIPLALFSHVTISSAPQCSPRQSLLHLRLSSDHKLCIPAPRHMHLHYRQSQRVELAAPQQLLRTSVAIGPSWSQIHSNRWYKISKQETI